MEVKPIFFSLILFLLIFCLTPLQTIRAANPLDIVINEIAWMGTDISANDEWVELYNNTKGAINLEGWVLKSEDGTPEIKLTGIIPANSFFILERTDDNAVPGITADLIYKGALGNNGEYLKLFDSSGNLIDEVDCSSGWFAGDNKTKQTMERKNSKISGSDSTNWQTSQNPGGTPKTKNSEQRTINNEQKTEKMAENSSPPNLAEKKEYPSGIILNEILPSPEGPDDKEEWIELFNQNNFEIDLTGWQTEDTLGKTTTYTFPKDTKISGQGFLVLSRPTTKITLNNDEDGLILSLPDGNAVDEVNYKKAPRAQSYNRGISEWFWSSDLTPGAANIVEKTETRSLEDKFSSENKEKRELAAIGGKIASSSRFPFVLLFALAIAIFSGSIILILKKTTTRLHPPKFPKET